MDRRYSVNDGSGSYPDNPPWTMFFDGPLYQKYDEFMRGKDFTKILLQNKLKLAHVHGGESGSVSSSRENEYWEFDPDAEPRPIKYPSDMFQSETYEYFRQFAEEEKRRTRRTRACIWLTIAIMAALAFGTALVIHYLVIPNDEDPKNNVNVSITGNGSMFGRDTTSVKPSATTEDYADEISRVLDVLNHDVFHTNHSDHAHFFDDLLIPASDQMQMNDVIAYVNESASIECTVRFAYKWTSLTLTEDRASTDLHIVLLPSNTASWSNSTLRHFDIIYDVTKDKPNSSHETITLKILMKQVPCRTWNVFKCILHSEKGRVIAARKSRLKMLGKPSDKVRITLGPSTIEARALRITARWMAGYPVPWANISWTATTHDGQTYELTEFGEYKDYKLQVDHLTCQTRLEHSLVIFPGLSINDSQVIVRPDLNRTSPFVDSKMKALLEKVKPGIDKMLIIPLNYCQNKTGGNIPHPYTSCTKFIRCIPGDVVVQPCPTGTCFWPLAARCV